jgi:GH24 family phage-related lysozyme (muramidase)
MSDLLLQLLRREENLRLDPYRDSEGYWTIGYGHLIDSRKGGFLPSWVRPAFPITAQEADELLKRDVLEHLEDLHDLIDTSKFGAVREAVFGSMIFQMGATNLKSFVNTLRAARVGDWLVVASGIRNSEWYRQTPRRAERMAKAIESGNVEDLGLG